MDSPTNETPVDNQVQSAEIDLDAKTWITEQVEKEVVRSNTWTNPCQAKELNVEL
jgi:hypothetical protein